MRFGLTLPFLAACIAAETGDGPARRFLPLALFAGAAATDFFDGVAARRAGGGSGAGHVLDGAADILFVGGALIFFAARGAVSWWAPITVLVAFAAYARDSWRASRSAGEVRIARTAVGRAAGVTNYVLVGLLAGDLALSGGLSGTVLGTAAGGTIALNVAAVLARIRHARPGVRPTVPRPRT